MFDWWPRRRRDRIRSRSFPPEWLGFIERNVRYFARLSPEDRAELLGHVQVFLAEKRFEGCDGLEVTDEIRVTVAAQACLLLLHRDTDYFPEVETILVYPAVYRAPGEQRLPDGTVSAEGSARLGESWHHGPVVLAWDDVLAGGLDPDGGHNLVLHEFAHKLDEEDGATNGAPRLPTRSAYAPWARVLGQEFLKLREEAAHHHRTVMDKYGATNPAEFFAVVTECFFEKPVALRRRHPELYEQLALFFQQDPASWHERHAHGAAGDAAGKPSVAGDPPRDPGRIAAMRGERPSTP